MSILRKEDARWQHEPTNFNGMLDLVVNPGDNLKRPVYDQVGTLIGTGLLWITRRWPSNSMGEAP